MEIESEDDGRAAESKEADVALQDQEFDIAGRVVEREVCRQE